MDNENRSCIDCGSAACRGKGGQFPPFCRTEHLDEALLERSLEILKGEENAFSCQVVRVIDDVFASILLLRPAGAEPDAPLLRMELDKAVWAAHDRETAVMAAIRPEDVLLLEDL